MKLADVLREECTLAGAEIADKAEALRLVTSLAKLCPALHDISPEEILRGLEEREELGSTGFGNGVAIPHCRLQGVTEFVVGLITLSGTIDFDAADRQGVNVIAFIVGPRGMPGRHLRVLSAVSKALLPPVDPKALLGHTTPQALRNAFLENVQLEIDAEPAAKKSGIFVVVEDEAVFGDLVDVMVPIALGSLQILDTEPAEAYLSKIPLFASFLKDRERSFGKILFAILDRGLVYEALRGIESVTGTLSERTGVVVAIQEFSFVAGSLEPQE